MLFLSLTNLIHVFSKSISFGSRLDILWGLISVQSVCKDYQQMTKVSTSVEGDNAQKQLVAVLAFIEELKGEILYGP